MTTSTYDKSTIVQAIKCNEDVQNILTELAEKMKKKTEMEMASKGASVASVGLALAPMTMGVSLIGSAIFGLFGGAAIGSSVLTLQTKPVSVISEEEIKEKQSIMDKYVELRDSVNKNIKAIYYEVDLGTLTVREIEEQLLPLLIQERTNLERFQRRSHI